MDKKSYKTAFILMLSDLKVILEYVEPVENNLQTYSHRIYELYLRVCTEFESVCKDMLIEKGYSNSPQKLTIKDYKTLYDPKNYNKITLHYWQPSLAVIEPFKDWEDNDTLFWYKSYNTVKHNRNAKFAEANFKNLIFSLAALFAVLALNGCFIGLYNQDFSKEHQAHIRHYYDYLHSHWEQCEIN